MSGHILCRDVACYVSFFLCILLIGSFVALGYSMLRLIFFVCILLIDNTLYHVIFSDVACYVSTVGIIRLV